MSINSTVEPERICPTLLVYGSIPKLPVPGSQHDADPPQSTDYDAWSSQRAIHQTVAQLRLKAAEKAFVPKKNPLSLKYTTKFWFTAILLADESRAHSYFATKIQLWSWNQAETHSPTALLEWANTRKVFSYRDPTSTVFYPKRKPKTLKHCDKANSQKEKPSQAIQNDILPGRLR